MIINTSHNSGKYTNSNNHHGVLSPILNSSRQPFQIKVRNYIKMLFLAEMRLLYFIMYYCSSYVGISETLLQVGTMSAFMAILF